MLGAFFEVPLVPVLSGAAIIVLLVLWAVVRSKKRT
jgi:hypothetical protein